MREVALVLVAVARHRDGCLAFVADLTLFGTFLCTAGARRDEKEGAGQSGRHDEETGHARYVRAKEGAEGK